jgi:hypothetical protein
MISGQISVNTVEYEGAMARLRQGVREGFVDPAYGTLTVQGRLLAQRCQEFTPPRNVAQGKAAVARDLTRIFAPLDQNTFRHKRLKKIIRTDNRPAWDAAAANFGDSHGLRNTKAMGFSEDWHRQNRISRGRGRFSKKGNLGRVTLGPEARRARNYIGTVQKRVGWAKAGWSMGIVALGGHVAQPWISRHGLNRGLIHDGRVSADPFVQVVNDTGWAKYGAGEGERIIRNAVQARARDMESYFFRMMKLAAERAQGAVAA